LSAVALLVLLLTARRSAKILVGIEPFVGKPRYDFSTLYAFDQPINVA
jgi:hypothetical protein